MTKTYQLLRIVKFEQAAELVGKKIRVTSAKKEDVLTSTEGELSGVNFNFFRFSSGSTEATWFFGNAGSVKTTVGSDDTIELVCYEGDAE